MLLLKSLSSAVRSPLNANKLDSSNAVSSPKALRWEVGQVCHIRYQQQRFGLRRRKKGEGKSVRNERTGPKFRFGLPPLPDAARDPDNYLRSVKKIGYMVWTAAGLYILVTCVLDQFSDFLGYWLPAISFAADNGVWWAQVPALAFLGAVLCFGVVMTGYHVLSRILD